MALSYIVLFCLSFTLIPTVHGQCKKKKSNVCEHLDYTQLQFPNLFGHTTEVEALEALKQSQVIARGACDDKLPSFRNYLCQLYFPPCTLLPEAVPPCQAVCAAAYGNCSASLQEVQVDWPAEWACEQFPQQGTCMGFPMPPLQITGGVLESKTGKEDKDRDRQKKPKVTVPTAPQEGPGGQRRPNFQQCVPFQSKFCPDLDYETAGFPNLMGNRSPQDAEKMLASLGPLLQNGCSPRMKDFLCGVQYPRCEGTDMYPPCRSLCDGAYTKCAGVLRQLGFQWPERLLCNNFPEDETCYKGQELEPEAPISPAPTQAVATTSTASGTAVEKVDLKPIDTSDLSPVAGMIMHPVLEWLRSSTNLNREKSKLAQEEFKLAVLNQQKMDLEISKLRSEQH